MTTHKGFVVMAVAAPAPAAATMFAPIVSCPPLSSANQSVYFLIEIKTSEAGLAEHMSSKNS